MKIKDHVMDVFDLEGSKDSLECFGGGGKGATTPAPVYTPPATAPEVDETATLLEGEDDAKRVKEAQKVGAKSLQIPIVGTGTSTVGTV